MFISVVQNTTKSTLSVGVQWEHNKLLSPIKQHTKHTPTRRGSISRPRNSGVACKGLSGGQEDCVLDAEEEAGGLLYW